MPIYNLAGKPLVYPTFKVAALNVGNFSLGASGDPAGTDELYNSFIKTFRECNPNIFMFSEWDANWVSGVTSESVFGFLKPHHSTYTGPGQSGSSIYAYTGQMIYSDMSMSSEYYQAYAQESAYYFLDNTIYVYGVPVHFICTHFTWKTPTKRMSQMQEVLDYIAENNLEYYIIGGDMNLGLNSEVDSSQDEASKLAYARQEITLLESNGAVSAQGSGWGRRDKDGFFNTAGHTGWDASSITAIDNIVVSPNIRIKNVDVVITAASDHDAVCADLELVF